MFKQILDKVDMDKVQTVYNIAFGIAATAAVLMLVKYTVAQITLAQLEKQNTIVTEG